METCHPGLRYRLCTAVDVKLDEHNRPLGRDGFLFWWTLRASPGGRPSWMLLTEPPLPPPFSGGIYVSDKTKRSCFRETEPALGFWASAAIFRPELSGWELLMGCRQGSMGEGRDSMFVTFHANVVIYSLYVVGAATETRSRQPSTIDQTENRYSSAACFLADVLMN